MTQIIMDKIQLPPIPDNDPQLHLFERKEQLEKELERLRFICDNLDPYSPIPEKFKKELRALGLQEIIDQHYDPFALTNKLLLRMENILEELEYATHA